MRVLVLIISHEMNGSLDNIQILKQFMDQSDHTVDYAGISSGNDFSFFEHILPFKYKFTCKDKQLTKVCEFIKSFKSQLDYDWYVKIRPEVKLLESINFSRIKPNAINARARAYVGHRSIKYGLSVPANLPLITSVSFDASNETFVLDDQLYIFDHSIIAGGYFETEGIKSKYLYEDEWVHTEYWKLQNTPLNVVGLNVIFTKLFDSPSRDIPSQKGIVIYGLRKLGK